MERDDKPLVSVIVTVYNREKWIEKCVNHLLVEQTFQDFEILLVDNGSTDHSGAVMKECQKKHPERIRIILASDNVGGGKNLPADSRQRGMENAKGKYFTFCDSDDRFLENGLELLVNAAIINQADMVIGDYITVDEKGHKISEYKFDHNYQHGNVSEVIIYNNCMCQPRLFRSEFARNNHINFPVGSWFEDTCFVLEFGYVANKVVITNQIVYEYLRNKSSTTNQSRNIKLNVENMPVRWFESVFKNHLEDYEGIKNSKLFIWKCISIIMEIVYNPAVVHFGEISPREAGRIAKKFGKLIRQYCAEYKHNPYFQSNELKDIVGSKYFYSVFLYKILLSLHLDVLAACIVALIF